jgi:nicotinamidase-related amidase
MIVSSLRRTGIALAALVLVATTTSAQTVVEAWDKVQPPTAPAVKEVTLDPSKTALLMLDFMRQNCTQERRPRCVASLPAMKKLLAEARAKGVFVVYSIISNTTTKDVWEEVAPKADEPWVQASADKFYNTQLDKILKDKKIETVITVGTAAQGAILYTASGAAFRGMKVVVPLDGISAENLYYEQYTAYQLTTAPGVGPSVTLTTSDKIKF